VGASGGGLGIESGGGRGLRPCGGGRGALFAMVVRVAETHALTNWSLVGAAMMYGQRGHGGGAGSGRPPGLCPQAMRGHDATLEGLLRGQAAPFPKPHGRPWLMSSILFQVSRHFSPLFPLPTPPTLLLRLVGHVQSVKHTQIARVAFTSQALSYRIHTAVHTAAVHIKFHMRPGAI